MQTQEIIVPSLKASLAFWKQSRSGFSPSWNFGTRRQPLFPHPRILYKLGAFGFAIVVRSSHSVPQPDPQGILNDYWSLTHMMHSMTQAPPTLLCFGFAV